MEEMGITAETVAGALATDSKAWIAIVGSEPAAFSMADGSDGSVFAMFVKPGYEGNGLGKLLMAEAEDYLFRMHEVIWLITHADEAVRANGFYRKLGWLADTTSCDGDVRYEKRRPAAASPES